MNKPFVKTNVLAYQLNSLALQQQWQLLKITVPKAEWQEYRKLRAMVSPDAVTCMQQVGEDKVYLWLVSKMIKVPNNSKLAISKVLFHRLHEDNISHSLILQLLMNRHNILKATGPMPNSASELLLVTDQMPHPDQSVVLAAEVTRSNELVMRVKTYTGTTKALQSEDVQIDWSRQLMVPHQGEQQVDRYRFGNRTNKHNTVGFADLVDENELAQTKIHFAWTLLNKMREYDAQYFRQLPTFVASELMLPENPGLPPKTDIWTFFEGESITVVYQPDDPDTKTFAQKLVSAINQSKKLKSFKISATMSNRLTDGLQLQVVHDLKTIKENKWIDTYQISVPGQWVQHVTIENFWSKKTSTVDPFNDAAMVKVMQELLVKRDLDRQRLHPMSAEMLETLSGYECVSFLKGAQDNQVELFKMVVSSAGKLQMSHRLMDLTQLTGSNSDEILCQRVLDQLGTGNWSQWRWIDYVLCSGDDLLIVMDTQRYVMLDEPAISQLLAGGASKQLIDPNTVIDALEELAAMPERTAEYYEVVDQLIADMTNLPGQSWTMGRLKQHLKGTKKSPTKAMYRITFGSAVQKAVSADLYAVCGLNFDASARRKADEANVMGLKGMGLTVIDGAYHYFVGTHQPLKTAVDKAIKFRKIVSAFDNQHSVEFHYRKMQIMMAVGFVNNARYTVRPLQVKYLREYQDRVVRLRETSDKKTDSVKLTEG